MSARKVIVTVALTGGLHGKTANPNLPEQPEEIAQDAYDCFNEGAAIVHIHARDSEGEASADGRIYRDIHERISKRCDIILQDTTGGGPNLTVEQRIEAVVKARPEMASLNMGTLVRTAAKGPYRNTIFRNTTDDIETFARAMLETGIKPEMEAYSHAMFREIDNLITKKLVEPPYYVNIVLGMAHQGAEPATTETLLSMIRFLPANSAFNVCAVGSGQLPLTTLGLLLGGNIRIGMEDNIYYRKGELARSNAQLAARSVRIIRELEMEPATPNEARAMLGIKQAVK
jgi:3-keto-5-aminohexanoate cleavage enzyme